MCKVSLAFTVAIYLPVYEAALLFVVWDGFQWRLYHWWGCPRDKHCCRFAILRPPLHGCSVCCKQYIEGVWAGCSGLLELLWSLASFSSFYCYFMQCILFSFLKLLLVFLGVSSLFVAGFYYWSVLIICLLLKALLMAAFGFCPSKLIMGAYTKLLGCCLPVVMLILRFIEGLHIVVLISCGTGCILAPLCWVCATLEAMCVFRAWRSLLFLVGL